MQREIKSIEITFWNDGRISVENKQGNPWCYNPKTGKVYTSTFSPCYGGGGTGISLPIENTQKEFVKIKNKILKQEIMELKKIIKEKESKIKKIKKYTFLENSSLLSPNKDIKE